MRLRCTTCLLLFLPYAFTLQCYICGDSNLEEFGECSTQFQYDCATYAQRFSPDEKIYCRTTRHKAVNETYTILKECISETDHYKRFPEKEYSLDEECDLVDIEGQEVAYCICKSDSLCNSKPIAEQFMSFEQKHPELFATDDSIESDVRASPVANRAPPFAAGNHDGAAAAAFGAPQIQPKPILPVNDPRFSQEVSQKEMLPAREDSSAEGKMGDLNSEEIDVLFRAREAAKTAKSEAEATVGRIDMPLVPPPARSSGFVFASNALNGKPITSGRQKPVGRTSEGTNSADTHAKVELPSSTQQRHEKLPPLPAPVLSAIPPSTLRCAQCGQAMLTDELSDCATQQIVDCAGTDTLCFTRQIILGPGQNAVEKMCVSKTALENEYGSEASHDGCSSTTEGKVRFCVCSKNECNKESIQKQMVGESKNKPPAVEKKENVETLPGLNSLSESIKEESSLENHQIPLQPIQPVNQPAIHNNHPNAPLSLSENSGAELPQSSEHFPLPEEPQPPRQPSIPSTKIQPVSAASSDSKKKNPVVDVAQNMIVSTDSSEVTLRCSACSESDLTDPTADCRHSMVAECHGEDPFCVTRQTQLATGIYSVEKRCISKEQFSAELPDEKLEEGCSTAFDGLVNYCVCATELCNKASLLRQVEGSQQEEIAKVPRTKLEPATEASPPPRQEWGGQPKAGPVPDSIDLQNELDQLKGRGRQQHVDITLPSEDVSARHRAWRDKEAQLTSAGEHFHHLFSTSCILSLSIIAHRFLL